MHTPQLDTVSTRKELEPFFHAGIISDGNGGIYIGESAQLELETLISTLSEELKCLEDTHPHNIRIKKVSQETVSKVAENSEEAGEAKRAHRLRKYFAKLIDGTLKKGKKGTAKKIVKTELTRFSYIIPIGYTDENKQRVIYPVCLTIWSNVTLESVIHSLHERKKILLLGLDKKLS